MSTTTSTGRRRSWSPLTVRLMLAQTAVLAVGLIIVVVTAVLIGPNMFYHELVQAGHADAATGLVHLQDAFRSVSLTALVIGGLPALYIAGLLTFYLYRTIGRSLASFSAAAWSWIGICFAAVVLFVVAWPLTTTVYEIHPAYALVLTLAHCLSLVLTLKFPWVGIGASLTVLYGMFFGGEGFSLVRTLLVLGIVGCVIGLKLLH